MVWDAEMDWKLPVLLARCPAPNPRDPGQIETVLIEGYLSLMDAKRVPFSADDLVEMVHEIDPNSGISSDDMMGLIQKADWLKHREDGLLE